MKPKNRRVNNLIFRPATYLIDRPKNGSWHIDKFYPNPFYGKESEYVDHGDYYTDPKYDELGLEFKIHKDCFKHPESCYAIASFDYDSHEPCWELKFICNRPLELTEEERQDFWELIKYGYKVLENYNEEENEE